MCRTIFRLGLIGLGLVLSAGGEAATRQVGSGQEFATVASALAAAAVGDTVIVHGGTYVEKPDIGRQGIALINQPGETPTIRGRLTISANEVLISGLEITGWSGNYTHGIYAAGHSGIVISNCVIHDGSLTPSSSGIYLRNAARSLIINNNVYGCDKGLNIVSAHSADSTYSGGVALMGNSIHDNPDDGIDAHGQFITIEGNNIFDNLDPSWMENHPDGIQLIAAAVDGYTTVQHCRIVRNTIRNHTQNVFTEGLTAGDAAECDDIQIANNVIYNDSGLIHGVNLDVIPIKNIMIRKSKNIYIYNNTIGRCSNNGILLQECSTRGLIFVKNNIIDTVIGVAITGEDTAYLAPGALNFNAYYRNHNVCKLAKTYYVTRADLAARSSHEQNGWQGDPKMNAFPSPTLEAGSSLIGRGVILDRIFAIDRAGQIRLASVDWDIGAYAYAHADALLPPAPKNLRLARP